MSYPSFEEYTDALRMPPSAVFQDPLLAGGSVRRNSAGVPFARSGNFALTYEVTVNGSRYAVRCFHKESDALERRYEAISRKLTSIASPWFMDFDFQPAGIRTESGEFPIVRMRWAEGCSLAQFISEHRDEPRALMQLRETLHELARHLQAHDIAHGDIQPGNIIVRSATDLKLIDYDGMFVPELEPWGSTELGQRNFQHPGRSWLHYDERLDRFSFALLDVALEALATQPALWELTGSDEAGIVLRAADFVDPAASTAFGVLAELDGLAGRARQLAAVCRSPFERVPALDDFLAGRRIPAAASALTLASASTATRPAYIPAYAVLNATNFARCCAHIGDRIELIGRVRRVVTEGVPDATGASLRVEFGDAREDMVRLSIWPDARESGQNGHAGLEPGQWLSAIGLVDPILTETGGERSYKSVSLAITEPSQLRLLTEAEALHRLAANDRPSRADHDVSVTIGTDPAIPGSTSRESPQGPSALSADDVAQATPTVLLPQFPALDPEPLAATTGDATEPIEAAPSRPAVVTAPVVTDSVAITPVMSAPAELPPATAASTLAAAPTVHGPEPTASMSRPAPPQVTARAARPPAPPKPRRRIDWRLRWSGLPAPAIRWPSVRWPALRMPAMPSLPLRWRTVRWPAMRWPARLQSVSSISGQRLMQSLSRRWSVLQTSLGSRSPPHFGNPLPRLRAAVRGVSIPAGLPARLRGVHPAWWLAGVLMTVVLVQSWIIARRPDTAGVIAVDSPSPDVAVGAPGMTDDESSRGREAADTSNRPSTSPRADVAASARAQTAASTAVVGDGKVRAGQGSRLLAFEDLRSARRPIATIAGPLNIVTRAGPPRLSLVAVNGKTLEQSGAEVNVLAHRSVYADREVIVGFSDCTAATSACERKEPFWLLLRKSKPPVFKRSPDLRANQNAGAVTAAPSGVHVDLGLWDGVRQTATLTSLDDIYITRVKESPAPLSGADCQAVAAALESCAASRACDGYDSVVRSVPAARMANVERLFHESTGLNAPMFRSVCVRSCELGMTPTSALVRREVCGGAAPAQWSQRSQDAS
jgi:hypothetical protein